MSNFSRRAFLATGLSMTALSTRPALAEAPAQTLPLDALAREIIALADPSTTAEGRKAFWTTRMSDGGKKRWPLEDFDRVMARLQAQSGGMDYLGAPPVGGGGAPRLKVRARKGGAERHLRVRLDRNAPDKLFDIGNFPAPAPYDGPRITGPVSREVLAHSLAARVSFVARRDEFSGSVRVMAPDGAVVFETATGRADVASGQLNQAETRFHLGSADKSFTAIETLRLVASGRLSLDTRLGEVMPDYPNKQAADAVTVRHLLTHSAGMGGLFDRPGWDVAKTKPFTRVADLLPIFAAEPLHFTPGSDADYSNEGFVVLGAVIEAVSGESWYDRVAKGVYGPAGMKRSGHFRYDQPIEGRAVGYRYADEDILGLEGRMPNTDRQGYRGNSCGGGYSTVRDMTAYLTALRAGRILDPVVVATMVQEAKGGLPMYGLGFQVLPTGGRTVVGHGGGGPHSGIDGDSAIVWETGWCWSVLGNYDAPFAGEVARDIRDWVALQT